MVDLSGRTALVTGSTSGIGLGIARAFAGAGARVMLNGLGDGDENEALGAHIADEFDVEVGFDGADMSDPNQISALIARTAQELGGPDLLVNNAGIQHTSPIESFPRPRWDAIIAINLSASFHTIQATLPAMRQRGWGRIINIASVHGLVASVEKAAYVAAKHGLVGLTKVVALEAATSGVTCNAICPGWVLTPLVQAQVDDRARGAGIPEADARQELLAEKQPSMDFATPAEIGDLALFLCSDAARQITGASLPIDGAWTAR